MVAFRMMASAITVWPLSMANRGAVAFGLFRVEHKELAGRHHDLAGAVRIWLSDQYQQ